MKKLLYLILIIPLVFTSCTKDPFANFVADRKIVEVGEEVYFTNRSSDAVEYDWDFGDGYYSYNLNAVHSWDAPGRYTVTLTAYGPDGTLDRATMVIEVIQPLADLLVIVEEFYEPYYLVEDARVRIYETLQDFDDEVNWLAEGYTDNFGEILFLDLPANRRYYVDVWGPNHGNYDLSLEDVEWVETDPLVPDVVNEFVAVVDYYPEGKKSAADPRALKLDRDTLKDKEGSRKKADRAKPEGIEQETR
ncbi:MAG: PKD domain-containing protein [bacterium]